MWTLKMKRIESKRILLWLSSLQQGDFTCPSSLHSLFFMFLVYFYFCCWVCVYVVLFLYIRYNNACIQLEDWNIQFSISVFICFDGNIRSYILHSIVNKINKIYFTKIWDIFIDPSSLSNIINVPILKFYKENVIHSSQYNNK